MKEKLLKIREALELSKNKLALLQGVGEKGTVFEIAPDDRKEIQEAIALIDAIIAEMDSDGLISKVWESLECEGGLAPLFNSTPETYEKQMRAAAKAAIEAMKG